MCESQSNLLRETVGEFHLPEEKIHSHQKRSAISGNVFLPTYDLIFTQKSTAFSDAIMWNGIPVSIKRAESLDLFEDKLKAYYLKIQNETETNS